VRDGFGPQLLSVPPAFVKDGLDDVGNKVVGDRSFELGGKGRRHAGNELPAGTDIRPLAGRCPSPFAR
jgi:hypothetical protein